MGTQEDKTPLPRLAAWLLSWLTPRNRREVLLGDFEEGYREMTAFASAAQARRWYWGQVVRSILPFLYQSSYWSLIMLRNYLKIALRQVRRQKGYAFINVSGLAMGIACCLFILLFVRDELSYDRFHENADRIVRLIEDVHTTSQTLYQATSAPAMGPNLLQDYPEVLHAVRFLRTDRLLQHGDHRFLEDHIVFADSLVFEVFDYPLLRGDPKTALTAPYSVVLAASVARKYFGEADPLGKTMTLENEQTLTVTGVLGELPRNAHLQFDIMLSFTTLEAMVGSNLHENWGWNSYYTYLLLPEGYDPARLEDKLPDFLERHIGDWLRSRGFSYTLHVQPLTEIYLHSSRILEPGAGGNVAYLYLFSSIAVFILIIACINFMNLATARSAGRAKEVGLRKVVGAQRGQLAMQFLGESLLTSVLALLFAVALFRLLLPLFNGLTGKALTLGALWTGGTVLVVLGLVLLVGVVAGLYPALVLSDFSPAVVLKGAFHTSKRGVVFRKGLVVFQFAISIILIVGTTVVAVQLDYLRGQNLGFEPEQQLVLYFDGDRQVQQQAETIKQVMRQHPAVISASMSSSVPGNGIWNNLLVHVDVAPGQTQEATLDNYTVDVDFIDNFGIEVVAGRGFSNDFATDATAAFVINEAAVKHFGWNSPEDALGKRFVRGDQEGEIIGVVKDFNYRSLRRQVDPFFLMMLRPDRLAYLTLGVRTEDVSQTVADVERLWKELAPQRPFIYTFLDDQFNQQYQAEARFGKLFGYFALLAIFIACLGLFGLASFTAQERTREIGVRKVLGATVPQIIVLLSKDFTGLVLIAFVVAVPVAYWGMEEWLARFAYRIEISWHIFLVAGLAALLVAWVTVSYQSIRAALANPVESLRYE